MTPYEHWQRYTARLHAPKNYLELAWYFMISAALQRRVWQGKGGEEIFPNQYLLFVAEPGVGKGLASRATKELLSAARIEVTADNLDGKALFPMVAESGSFEKLVTSMVENIRIFNYLARPEDTTKTPYAHSSCILYLDEITSLVHKDNPLVIPFLLSVFSGARYERSTHKRGHEVIRNTCLSMLSNTQPDTFQELLRAKVVGTGLLGRTLISYAPRNSFNQFFIPDLTAEAEESKQYLVNYLKSLAGMFGPIKISDEAREFLQDLWEHHSPANKSPYLKEYYGRKNIHATKLAMAVHFARTLQDYTLTLDDYRAALAILEREEKMMHFAFTTAGLNKFAGVALKIERAIAASKEPMAFDEILLEFYSEVNGYDLGVIINDLVTQHKLVKITTVKGVIAYGKGH